MLERMYQVCSDVLTLAAQLSSADNLPAPEVLQRRIDSLFEEMSHRARVAQIPSEDVTEAKYALAAFMDEQILRSTWPARTQWMARPLQFIYFNENTAGEGFFQRLEGIMAMPHRSHVMLVYYLCLSLGFQGKYAVRGGGELDALIEQLQHRLARQLPPADTFSPHGEPRDTAAGGAGRQLPWIGLSVGLVVLALILLIVLQLLISGSAARAADDIRQAGVSLCDANQGWG